MIASQSSILIRFDKSHLTSIGERLYVQSLDLARELVANAYDADATYVSIAISADTLTVSDNGSGMDRAGLEQYFTIGSAYKKAHPISPRYKRVRIGEFGIGKFAVLGLCDRFELYTTSAGYAATVVFDRRDFEHSQDWSVPIIEHAPVAATGTLVSLYQVKKQISLLDLERYLTNLFPLTEKTFAIFLNDRKLQPKYIPGERLKIQEYSQYGTIKGEIIISSLLLPKELVGIGVHVKGVLIKRDLFDLDKVSTISFRKITGIVNADFLPITTDRSDFIADSQEYIYFKALMEKKLKRTITTMEKQALSYQDKKSEKVLSDVLSMIREALKSNHDMFMSGDLPLFARKREKKYLDSGITDSILGKAITKPPPALKGNLEGEGVKDIIKKAVKNLKPRLRARVKTLLRDDRRIIKKIKIGGTELLVSFAHLGADEKESFVDGGIIFINRDHALFKHIETKKDLVFYHLVRLVAQELVKFAYPKNLDIAFDWHGKLIKDAYTKMKLEKDAA